MTNTTQLRTKHKTIQRRKTVNYPTICGTPNNGGTSRVSHLGKLRLLAFAIGAQALAAQHSLASTLDHLSYTTLPGNQQQIAFKLSDPVNDTQTFKIDNPARIAIDLMGTTNALDKRVVPVGVGNLESVSIVETDDRTRVVLKLGEMTEYQTKVEGDRLLVTLDSDAEGIGQDLGELAAEVLVDEVSDGDLLQTTSGELPEAELLPLAETELLDTVTETADTFEAETAETFEDEGLVVELPSSLPLDYSPDEDTSDSDVMPIDQNSFQVETGAPIEEYVESTPIPAPPPRQPRLEDVGYPAGADRGIDYSRQTPVSLNPPTFKPKPVVYNGEELSLNFQDIEIRSVLQLLADFTDMNIVVSDNVGGKLTLRLKNVPWDQALDIILRTKGLDKRRSGNVIMVAPASEIAAQETAEREAAQQAIALEPLRTEFVQVNYAKANDVAAILKSESGGLLTERGNVTIDDRTNTLLVNDTALVHASVLLVTLPRTMAKALQFRAAPMLRTHSSQVALWVPTASTSTCLLSIRLAASGWLSRHFHSAPCWNLNCLRCKRKVVVRLSPHLA